MNQYPLQSQLEISPTPFLSGPEETLLQRLDMTITNYGDAAEAALRFHQSETHREIALGLVPAGESHHEVYLPIVEQPTVAEFILHIGDAVSAPLHLTRRPPKRWTVHVVQTSHHDLGYTGLPSRILRQHDRWLNDALEYARATEDYPDEAKFRIVIEQAWSLEHFLETASPDKAAEMVARLRTGQFELTALYANLTTEICSSEELVRAVYPSARLKRRYGIPILTAEHNDITGMSWGLTEALYHSGVRLFIPGFPLYYNWGYSGLQSFWDQETVLRNGGPDAFYWQTPSGEKMLVWCNGSGCGGDFRASLPGLSETLARLENQAYPYNILRWPVIGAGSDNSPYRPDFADSVRDWNVQWTYPRLVLSTNARFYIALSRNNLVNLPVFRGELPGQDYPVAAASTAAATALNRRSHVSISVAETAAAIASKHPAIPYPREDLDEAWRDNLLHDEHAWGFQFPAGPAADASRVEKLVHAHRAAALIHDVTAKSLASLGIGSQPGPCVMVFNSLGCLRSGLVRLPLRPLDNANRVLSPVPGIHLSDSALRVTSLPGRDHLILPAEYLTGHFDLIDLASGKKIAYQIEKIDSPDTPVPYAADRLGLGRGTKRLGLFEEPFGLLFDLVFFADDIPACGYKTYRLILRSGRPRFPHLLRQASTEIENEFYRIRAGDGGVCSILDKESGRELLDQSAPHRLGALVVRDPEGAENVSRLNSVRRGISGPVSVSLELTFQANGHPSIRQFITLSRRNRNIDLAVNVLKDASPLLDAHLAFPFYAPEPSFRYEGALSSLSPVVDSMPGAQSDRLAAQNWVRVTSGDTTILWSALDAPIVSLGRLWDGYVSPAHRCLLPESVNRHRRLEPQDFDRGWIYSLLFANNFGTNFYPSQSGYALFRYRFSSFSGQVDDPQSSHWGDSSVCDLEAALLPNSPDTPFLSCLRVENARLLAFKRAEDDEGWIVRLHNPAPHPVTASLSFPGFPVTTFCPTNVIEENMAPYESVNGSVMIHISTAGLATLRLPAPNIPLLSGD
jgi:hypothetical protein